MCLVPWNRVPARALTRARLYAVGFSGGDHPQFKYHDQVMGKTIYPFTWDLSHSYNHPPPPEEMPQCPCKSPPFRHPLSCPLHLVTSPLPNLKASSVAATYSQPFPRPPLRVSIADILQHWAWGGGRIRKSPGTKTSSVVPTQLQVVLPGGCSQFRVPSCLTPMPPGKIPTSFQHGNNKIYPGKVLSIVPGM